MSFLHAEIERKRKLQQAAAGGRKYRRKAEIVAEAAAAVATTATATPSSSSSTSSSDAAASSSSSSSKNPSSPTSSSTASNSLASTPTSRANTTSTSPSSSVSLREEFFDIPLKEVYARLRRLQQPITFFGEDREARLRRLQLLESTKQVEYERGQKNDFAAAMKEIDALREEDEQAMVDGIVTDSLINKRKDRIDYRSLTPKCDEDRILFFLKVLLREWEDDLDARETSEKKTTRGKLALATFKQTCNYITPLFRHLKKRTLPADILREVGLIVENMKQREYVRANDAYIRMAIGNAPWPIGVTMVGIHERSAREKIFSNQVAHVLNDEVQRKYIQSVKRLMTYCQQKYPNDPSKCMG